MWSIKNTIYRAIIFPCNYERNRLFRSTSDIIRWDAQIIDSFIFIAYSLSPLISRLAWCPAHPVKMYLYTALKNRDTSRATRSCESMYKLMRAIHFRRLLRRRSIISENGTSNARPICIGTYKRYHTCNTQVSRRMRMVINEFIEKN